MKGLKKCIFANTNSRFAKYGFCVRNTWNVLNEYYLQILANFAVKDLTNRPLYLQLLRHLSGVSQSYALNIGPHNP